MCVPLFCVPGNKPDSSKTGGKKGIKIIQDPHYRRYGCTVDMDYALETFRPHRLVAKLPTTYCSLTQKSQFFFFFFSSRNFVGSFLNPVQWLLNYIYIVWFLEKTARASSTKSMSAQKTLHRFRRSHSYVQNSLKLPYVHFCTLWSVGSTLVMLGKAHEVRYNPDFMRHVRFSKVFF